MMMRLLALSALVALTACENATLAVDDAARRSAKLAVSEIVVTRFPVVPKALITPFFARDAVIGVSDTTAALVRTVLERPETQQCVVRAGVSTLGTG